MATSAPGPPSDANRNPASPAGAQEARRRNVSADHPGVSSECSSESLAGPWQTRGSISFMTENVRLNGRAQATMTHQPVVSVIIPIWNAVRFLPDAIESVFAQTYPHWELLLVDDASTDGSGAIAREYAEAQPGKVRYLEHEGHQNRGVGASRNLGVWNATGRYIAFLDHDDI